MNLTNINTVREILSRHGFNFSKGLGQNFIINPDICPKIAENGNARSGYGVLEIGTGIGVLTKELSASNTRINKHIPALFYLIEQFFLFFCQFTHTQHSFHAPFMLLIPKLQKSCSSA